MGIATFVYADWALRFPDIAAVVPQPLATMYFNEATDFLDNTDASLVVDVAQRTRFLYLLTAHIATLGYISRGGMVGRLSSVTQGSISLSSEYAAPNSAAWYTQTGFGAQYWAATAQYHSGTYVPAQQPFLGVPGYGGFPWRN